VLIVISALQLLHFCFDTTVNFAWSPSWISWLQSLTHAFTFDLYIPRGWEACLAVLLISAFFLSAFTAYGAILSKWHNANQFQRIQDVVQNSHVSSSLCSLIPTVRIN